MLENRAKPARLKRLVDRMLEHRVKPARLKD